VSRSPAPAQQSYRVSNCSCQQKGSKPSFPAGLHACVYPEQAQDCRAHQPRAQFGLDVARSAPCLTGASLACCLCDLRKIVKHMETFFFPPLNKNYCLLHSGWLVSSWMDDRGEIVEVDVATLGNDGDVPINQTMRIR